MTPSQNTIYLLNQLNTDECLTPLDLNLASVAINAHVAWKKRLYSLLEGENRFKLDPDHVCLDDQCILGKWLHGLGKAHERKKHTQSC